MLPVLVGSHPNSPWLEECLQSIRDTTSTTVVVHTAGGHEPHALSVAASFRFDRFLFLQDSTKILSPEFWDAIEAQDGPCWLFGHPPMFMAVYDVEDILPLVSSRPLSKAEAIATEVEWPAELNYPSVWPEVRDATALRREQKHGRDNLVLGNDHIEKWKGTWR